MVTNGIITNIQRCSTEDGPGIRTTVFLKGCPLSCLWCHNIETISPDKQIVWHGVKCIADEACIQACPEGALKLTAEGMQIDKQRCILCGACENVCPTGAIEIMGTEWEAHALAEELKRDRVFFQTSNGGVTISGGEPLAQPAFTQELARLLNRDGVHVALDTTGYASERIWRNVIRHVDLILFDLKLMDDKKHREYTGVGLEAIHRNAKIINEYKIPVWVRTPVIPGHTDDEDNILEIAQFIKKNMPTCQRYDLLAFNNMCIEKYGLFGLKYPLRGYDLIEKDKMEQLAKIARNQGIENVCWSGMTRSETETKNSRRIEEVKSCG
ncbi:glycyl-radical enzyme activating protein [Candidatus Thorarchaeota archaeon]|nr:MAG: glycyl-radical enzyme activating protein [Candidatus Thorarchaeota archaeon]